MPARPVRPTRPDPPPRRPAVWLAWAVVLAGLTTAVVLLWSPPPPRGDGMPRPAPSGSTTKDVEPLPLPDRRLGRHLNTQAAAKYVGAAACVDCHAGEHGSFLLTPHSQALGKMGDASEPAPGKFFHDRSMLAYSTVGTGAETRHRVTLDDVDGTTLVECEFPIQYHIGSGNHSRSYLIGEGDFLFESPLTWYAARNDWALSPGYDGPLPLNFERIVDQGCLVCHAGRVESSQDNRFRSTIIEGTIGCESCHGPGSLHVAHWRDRPRPTALDDGDPTIVNPARLSRDEAEQICSFCHLRGAATIAVRGRRLTDFRPGLPLTDYRVDYFPQLADSSMRVTGHVEQMRRSKCYQASPELTCITCHDPHARPAADQRVEHFRGKCLQCHEQPCALPEDVRRKREPNDDCVVCHMPRGGTDIPHFAFTHHRIGLHVPDAPAEPALAHTVPRLVPGESLEHLPRADQLRCLGLAYVEFSEKQPTPAAARTARQLGRESLQQAYELGIRDSLTLATLAALAMERGDRQSAVALANAALAQPDAETGSHATAGFVLGNAYLEQGDPEAAEAVVLDLVRERWRIEDWLLLAEIRLRRRNATGAVDALRAAERLNPFRPDVHHFLADALLQAGEESAARRHQRIERRLSGFVNPGGTGGRR